MKRLSKYFFVVLLVVVFYASSINLPRTLNPDGTASVGGASVAEAQKGGKPKKPKPCKGKKCVPPPTVSELPIQYMVLSGAAVIALSGGMVFYIRKQKMKNSLEA
jgi:hypothetical protein